MAFLDVAANEAAILQGRSAARAIHLGDAERAVILTARRDAQARRKGIVLSDRRLEALRLYAMLGQRPPLGASRALIAAGFSNTERRIVDAMIGSLPVRAPVPAPVTSRLVCALLILAPLLIALAAFGWASTYLEDNLIAIVVGGLASLLVMPLVGAVFSPAPRPAIGR